MEVHHHSHTHGKKNWKSYFWEFLMLFLAVSLGFYAENLREHIKHEKEIKTNMRSLLSDLQSDIFSFDSLIDRNTFAAAMCDSVIDLFHSDISNTPAIYYAARTATANVGYYYSNSKSFDQMKSSGLLRYIKSRDLLDSIGNYYGSFQWLANLAELMRLKLDAVHKGNLGLFDSYTFYQMMKIDYPALNRPRVIINKPEGHPVLLSTDFKTINSASLNYHYYSATTKFYNRTADFQRQRAKQLLELIRKEYGFK